MKKNARHWATLALSMIAVFFTSCKTSSSESALRADALDASAWEVSTWISATNAPVVTGRINDHENGRAADGASWFVCKSE